MLTRSDEPRPVRTVAESRRLCIRERRVRRARASFGVDNPGESNEITTSLARSLVIATARWIGLAEYDFSRDYRLRRAVI